MSELVPIEPEYVYVTIPAEYICVYHRILAMLADYGEDMLKDCKASCTDKNSGVIECFNMFNSAVAARKLGKTKLAETIIKYIKAKINQIYKGIDNSTSFVFPVDENGELKAFISCGERPKFEINPDDMELYEYKFGNGFPEQFSLSSIDFSKDGDKDKTTSPVEDILQINFTPKYIYNFADGVGERRPDANIEIYYNGTLVPLEDTIYQFYFDDVAVNNFQDVGPVTDGIHNFKCVITYENITKTISVDKIKNNSIG